MVMQSRRQLAVLGDGDDGVGNLRVAA